MKPKKSAFEDLFEAVASDLPQVEFKGKTFRVQRLGQSDYRMIFNELEAIVIRRMAEMPDELKQRNPDEARLKVLTDALSGTSKEIADFMGISSIKTQHDLELVEFRLMNFGYYRAALSLLDMDGNQTTSATLPKLARLIEQNADFHQAILAAYPDETDSTKNDDPNSVTP